jgi:hypothetical protein
MDVSAVERALHRAYTASNSVMEEGTLQYSSSVAINMVGYIERCSPAGKPQMDALVKTFGDTFFQNVVSSVTDAYAGQMNEMARDSAGVLYAWAGFISGLLGNMGGVILRA